MVQKKEKHLLVKDLDTEGIKLKEKICNSLENKPHKFYVEYVRNSHGIATIMARNMKEAQEMLEDGDYEMEDDDNDVDFFNIEDSEYYNEIK